MFGHQHWRIAVTPLRFLIDGHGVTTGVSQCISTAHPYSRQVVQQREIWVFGGDRRGPFR